MIDLNRYKGRYLIAVSGGPDSMALFDMLRKTGCYLEAAHVNYHKRETALRDEKLVRKYCREHQIRFHRLHVYPEELKGNFQAKARKVRYEYFASLCKKHKLDAVMVAHQQDDLIETYLMQKEKQLGVCRYGLAEDTIIEGVRVIRPLLSFQKEELLAYCKENQIPYGIDESNLNDSYARNRIRHAVVERLSASEKKKIIAEIAQENEILQKKKEMILKDMRDTYPVEEFLALPYLEDHLRILFPSHSKRHYQEMIRQLSEAEKYVYEEDKILLVKEYGRIDIFEKPEDYAYVFRKKTDLKAKTYAHFRISTSGRSTEAMSFSSADFPLVFRNCQKGDQIRMTYGSKKINRYFIDHKIRLKERLCWPVVINKNSEVILVPGLGCDKFHYSQHPDAYVLKL